MSEQRKDQFGNIVFSLPSETAQYKIGDSGRLICGDCLEVMRKMPENSVDAIVTDPP